MLSAAHVDVSCCAVLFFSQVAELTGRLQSLCALYGVRQQRLAGWMGVDVEPVARLAGGGGEEAGAATAAEGLSSAPPGAAGKRRAQATARRYPRL